MLDLVRKNECAVKVKNDKNDPILPGSQGYAECILDLETAPMVDTGLSV